mmetsp:Transcript_28530/g.45985  ORF Transcript_28530/g.45985 Transcript_28530/m.45985 type:complete len:787 (+) Transcript_28530:255-2615(+)
MVLERISEEKVGRINKNPRMDIQKLENLNQCIKFIKEHDIQLVNIGSSDILKGNEKLILGLLWTIILRFEVAGADGKAGLLLWLQRSTKGYAGVDVKDFTSSWKDGLAFNALIHRYRPDLLTYDDLSSADALGNCEKAFTISEEKLGITRLLDPEDVVVQPDEKSQVAYLSQFFKLFAGQAKLESKLKAIKNAVEVTRRHDDWINQYQTGSEEVTKFANENTQRLGSPSTPSSTAEVKQALDEFSTYMKDVKPEMSAKRAETEGIYTTLTSSKRNNKRPEFCPVTTVASMNEAWGQLESVEQGYERSMLDKYLAFQQADHAVSKFNAKSATVNTWLDEKNAIFDAGVTGSSVPEIEAHLEMQLSFENRLGLYATVVDELGQIVSKAETVQGHSGVSAISSGMSDLRAKVASTKERGVAHRQLLEQALAAEKALVEKEKAYLHKIDNLDFTVDQMEERLNEEIVGATAAEIQERQALASSFEQDVASANSVLAEVSILAQEIAQKRPDAASHCAQQQQRLDALKSKMGEKQAGLTSLLSAEQQKDTLSQDFAQLANAFAEYCDGQRNTLAGLSGSLDDQRASLAATREETAATGETQMQALGESFQKCEAAQVVANPYTSHTIYSLRAQYDQLIKDMKRTDDALSSQLMAQKSLEIPAEQLKEIQEIFGVFDQDNDGKLRLADLREACLGAGIDLEDAELEKRMRARSSNMLFTLDDFVAFFIEEVQTGDTEDDVVSAFEAVSSSGTITPEQIQGTFGAMNQDLADYLTANIGDGDFKAFTKQLFTR